MYAIVNIAGQQIKVEEGQEVEEQRWFSVFFASYDFEKVLNLEFIDGHGFIPGRAIDSVGYIINQATAREMGWKENEVIGKTLDRNLACFPHQILS